MLCRGLRQRLLQRATGISGHLYPPRKIGVSGGNRGLALRVPHEVVQQVEAGGRTQFAREEFRAASWLEKRTIATSIPQLLQSTLDPGEAAVIAVATSEHIATVAIDETVGRRIGRLHGLSVTGSLGILIQAKQHGSPIMLRAAIARMRQHGIWLSNALEKECLRAAGE